MKRATADDQAEAGQLAEGAQGATGESVDPAYVDQGHTSEKTAAAAG